jgi:hypothetical protein
MSKLVQAGRACRTTITVKESTIANHPALDRVPPSHFIWHAPFFSEPNMALQMKQNNVAS